MKQIGELNFIRAFSALGIVIYHYSCHVKYREFLPFFEYANDGWGNILVTVFFMLSGLLLYLNHSKLSSLKEFYFKRWKSIFPTFYLAYGFFFIINAIQQGRGLFSKGKINLLLSVLGLDGYFSYTVKTYYILGEWFLGALIILYFLFPLILRLTKKYEIQVLLTLLLVFLLLPSMHFFNILPFRNILSCLFSFYFGMVVGKYKLFYSGSAQLIASVIFLIMYFVPLPPYFHWIASHVTGMAFFFVLFGIGTYIMRVKCFSRFFNEISSISYEIFLLQHIVILWVLKYRHPQTTLKSFLLLVIIMALTCVYAKILSLVAKAVLHSKAFTWFQNKILTDRNAGNLTKQTEMSS